MVFIRQGSKDFLMLIQPPGVEGCSFPIKAIVRNATLSQCGHWMMGTVRIYNHSLTVSGAYGEDGLIMDVPMEVYLRAQVYLPDHLKQEWSKGGGWNSAGSEITNMRQWANDNIKALRG